MGRQRRPWGPRMGCCRPVAELAAVLPARCPLQGEERPPGQQQQPDRRRRRRHRGPRPAGHHHPREGRRPQGPACGRAPPRGRQGAAGGRRPRRPRQLQLQVQPQLLPRDRGVWRRGLGVVAVPRAQARGGRGDRRHPERGEEHPAERPLLGKAQDRRLPVHDPDPQPRRLRARLRDHRLRRRARAAGGGAPRAWPRARVPPPHGAVPSDRPRHRRVVPRPHRRLQGHPPGDAPVQPRDRREARGRRVQQDGPPRLVRLL
mmetsp:Transcript_33612/g.79790  ORF Transcript_33612/g.79790 Transcript_33612/m.79790 type:complete len:260 (-) Transcript_33612:1746-2525(-)